MPVRGVVLSVIVALMWAVSPVLMKEGMKHCTPNEVPPVRSVSFIVTMSLLMLIIQPGQMPYLTPKLLAGLMGSVALSTLLGDLLFTYSIQKIGASLAVSVSCGYPLIAVLFSILLLGEQVSFLVWCGTVLIVLGLLVIKLDASLQSGRNAGYKLMDYDEMERRRADMTKGILFALGSAVCSGINIPVIKLLMLEGGWNATESYFLRATAFFIMAWTLREVQHHVAPETVKLLRTVPAKSWLALLGSGIIGMAVSGVIFGKCIDEFPVSVVTPVTASSPFMTVILSRIFLKEKLSRMQCAGVSLVIAGSVSVSL
ncbi:MAG: DMT family transporter [Synergistaceae bacterium]|jgi:drug/metabolite transporter (DMT)-like permease|nr:DMT family transporter [Synergistaceae bacterium]